MNKSPFLAMERGQQRSALEALLFASDDALSARALYKLLIEADEQAAQQEQQEQKEEQEPTAIPEAGETPTEGEQHTTAPDIAASKPDKQPSRQVKMKELTTLFDALVDELNADLEHTGRAFRIVKVAGGYQFATTAMHGELVARLVKSKSKRRLSQAALETLAIISYRQPITKPEIESIRGVSCNEVVNTLLEKNLVTIAGRSDSIGKPLLYGTTDEFLRAFGLHDISDLPKPRELEELMESRADILNGETVVIAEGEKVEEFEERLHSLGKKDAEHEASEQRESDSAPHHAQELPSESSQQTTTSQLNPPLAEEMDTPVEQPDSNEHIPLASEENEPEDTVPEKEQNESEKKDATAEEIPSQPEIRKMKVVMTTNGRPW